jgi:hypothetical protein
MNRRRFLSRLSLGIGSAALGSLLIPDLFSSTDDSANLAPVLPHFAPRAKRIIYLFQNGAPSQLETFDYKPMLREMMGKELPQSIRNGQRLTGMTSGQSSFPLVGSFYDFKQYGESRAWISDKFPHGRHRRRHLHYQVRHAHRGHQPRSRFNLLCKPVPRWVTGPAWAPWLSYGLGTENQNLPAFCVLLSKGKGNGRGRIFQIMDQWILNSIHQGSSIQQWR